MSSNLPPSRRALLIRSASVLAATAAPAWLTPAQAQQNLRPTPSQTEGPYYPVALPADTDFDLLRTGSVAYGKGQPAWVEGVVTDTRGVPVSGAVVEIWQCDQAGHYHHPGDGGKADPAFQGFGQVTVGRDGRYRFRTLRPAPYSGRTPHIHVKVKLDRQELLTTQMYVAGDPGNERDFLWRRLGEQGQAALTRPFVAGADGLRAEFPIVVMA
ncbi:protocatechuate 3,4-dioxygenase [Hydrogenophaga sp.]|jgi:protocatechuate 3,4-dioxygenase beta subunit|uniref:protocatechuate 3,4-dioxygenase n=1 Tax=Hydrogenophaga sp. TaxID=1904254 RepID=UPI00271B0B84|nr:protocatechuate 3,4-dioxygenase [Hydrogenophaga sp.]MDZ4360325.1 protocatechuate 3,4-dioxygenase [Variovorax sp.]MDO9251611.1 protocatechuate 3,4-dioxygenase [Hydrogenophaga sp.]MDP2405253.1 protocatechuate 3,4-dioxygenase [Hydrogenophaga sp.]MDP3322445.1 protocatechuate 3,4-dioxygenase [Hydrogenophaga sp.]MDP3885934.1 protocatechuate 3,4-dioxygenase [Hydrogenophaga sp.]